MMRLEAVEGIGEIAAGDDLASIIAARTDGDLADGDVVVVTSKVVSKAAGLGQGDMDRLLAEQTDRVVAERGPTRIVRTVHGLTIAAAGIDASNVDTGTFLPLPPDPDGSARTLRARLHELTGRRVAVVISDTAGRAWRRGQTDLAVGCAGLLPMESFAGREDTHGNPLAVTAPAVADEVAGAAELASGKLGRRPVVVVRGLAAHLLTDEDGPGAASLIRPEGEDLFGLGAREAVVAAVSASPPAPHGAPPRGFPPTETTPRELLELAGPVAGLDVAVEGSTVDIVPGSAGLETAGALRQRLETLARAHGLDLVVRVRPPR